jgi:predicted DNA-binding transcriptional regulator YafY
MRADRLINMIMILQKHKRVTAAALAKQLEVSERTIYRDVVALSTAGVPVYTEKGPGGGIRLVEDYQTSLTGLSPNEIRVLFMLNVPEAMSMIGMNKELQSALLKLTASLPNSLQQAEYDVRQRVLIDPDILAGSDKRASSQLADLYQAVWQDKIVRVMVQYGFGVEISHEILAYSLVSSGENWFLIGKLRDNFIWIELDRIKTVEVLSEIFVRDEKYNLQTYWDEWKTQMKSNLFTFKVVFLVKHSLAKNLSGSQDYQIINVGEENREKNGWVKMELAFNYFDKARDWALSYGGAVEIIEPIALRMSVVDYARQTLTVHEH